MLRLLDHAHLNFLSDLVDTLEEKLSDMVAYKPVFDLIHSVMQAARVKINNKERDVSLYHKL